MIGYLFDAIQDRIQADTGTGGLYNGGGFSIITGAYAFKAAGATVRPYLVYNADLAAESAMTSDGVVVTVTFTIVDNAQTGMENIIKVWNRLYGDAMLQAGRIPSYGFNRHSLSLPSSPLTWIGNQLSFASSTRVEVDGEDTVGMELVFTGRADAVAVSP